MTKFRKLAHEDDIEGRRVLVPYTIYQEAVVTGGFGSDAEAHGSAVFVKFDDDETMRFERHEILAVEPEKTEDDPTIIYNSDKEST
jgi:hypothetical protein